MCTWGLIVPWSLPHCVYYIMSNWFYFFISRHVHSQCDTEADLGVIHAKWMSDRTYEYTCSICRANPNAKIRKQEHFFSLFIDIGISIRGIFFQISTLFGEKYYWWEAGYWMWISVLLITKVLKMNKIVGILNWNLLSVSLNRLCASIQHNLAKGDKTQALFFKSIYISEEFLIHF